MEKNAFTGFRPSGLTSLLLGAGLMIFAASQAFAQKNPERNVYYGEQHLHTSWSYDAYAFGDTLTGPDTFYCYALGQSVMHPGGYKVKISEPLDWAADTEHSMHGLQNQYEIRDGHVVTNIAGTPFEVTVYKLGNKYYGARSNEFGYANYEVNQVEE